MKVRSPPSSEGPGSAKQSRSRFRQAVKVPESSAPRLYFLAESIRCPSELRCLTRLKNVPIRVEAWVSWWTTPAARSIVWDRSSSCQGPGSAKQWRSRSLGSQTVFPGGVYPVPKWTPVLDTPKNVPIRVEAWVAGGRLPQHGVLSGPFQFLWRSGVRQAVKVPVPPSSQGPGSAKQWRSRSLGSQTVFPGGVYPVPKWTPVLDTPKKRAHPCRSLGKLVDDSRSTEYCLGPFYLYCSSSSGVRQAVKVPVPPSSEGPGVRQAVKVPDPQLSPTTSVRLRNISSSSGSRRVRSHWSDSPVQFLSRSRIRQAVKVPESAKQWRSQSPAKLFRSRVPDPQLSPTTSVRLRNISSSSGSRRVRSHRSDSPVQFLSRSSFRSKNTSPFQIQPYESDPIDPTRFYSSVYGSKFQTGPRLITSVGGPIPGSRIHQVESPQHKFRSEVRAGSSRTFPDDLPWEPCESACWGRIFSNLWGNYLAPIFHLVVGRLWTAYKH